MKKQVYYIDEKGKRVSQHALDQRIRRACKRLGFKITPTRGRNQYGKETK